MFENYQMSPFLPNEKSLICISLASSLDKTSFSHYLVITSSLSQQLADSVAIILAETVWEYFALDHFVKNAA